MIEFILITGFTLIVFIVLFLRGLINIKNERINSGRKKCTNCIYCIWLYNSGFTACRNKNNPFYMSSTMIEECRWKRKR